MKLSEMKQQANVVIDRMSEHFGISYSKERREELLSMLVGVIKDFPPPDPNDGAALISAERSRQMKEEGWSSSHDDQWRNGELATVAVCYVLNDTFGVWWPTSWDKKWWKPKDKIRNLVRAGALIAAEIDRLQKLADEGGDGR